LGRSTECEITINDSMLSRFHCYIEYKEFVGWIINDGYFVDNSNYTNTIDTISEHKASTNGTWLYMNEDTILTNDMIFKANHTLFKVKNLD